MTVAPRDDVAMLHMLHVKWCAAPWIKHCTALPITAACVVAVVVVVVPRACRAVAGVAGCGDHNCIMLDVER